MKYYNEGLELLLRPHTTPEILDVLSGTEYTLDIYHIT
jgi:hypothetical protein